MAPVIALALLLGQSAWHCAWAEGPGGPAKKLARSACDHAAFRVVVDVGHTAESPGAPSARGFWEYDFNLRLATLIKQKLLAAGFAKTVLLVTDGPAAKAAGGRQGRCVQIRSTDRAEDDADARGLARGRLDHQSRRRIGNELAGAPIAHRRGRDRRGRRLLRHTAAANSRSRGQPG